LFFLSIEHPLTKDASDAATSSGMARRADNFRFLLVTAIS